MNEKPWLERIFGPSYHTSLAGYGGALLAFPCILLGYFLDIAALIVTGLSILTGAVALIGQLARSNSASTIAHQESLDGIRRGEQAHAANVQKIEAVHEVVSQVPVVAAKVAEEVVKDELQKP